VRSIYERDTRTAFRITTIRVPIPLCICDITVTDDPLDSGHRKIEIWRAERGVDVGGNTQSSVVGDPLGFTALALCLLNPTGSHAVSLIPTLHAKSTDTESTTCTYTDHSSHPFALQPSHVQIHCEQADSCNEHHLSGYGLSAALVYSQSFCSCTQASRRCVAV
jgi:hypothetical protein